MDNYIKMELEFSRSLLNDAQNLYKAQNASDIFAGIKKETMPAHFLTEIVAKHVKSALEQKRKAILTKRQVALAELQAKGMSYKDACKVLGITLTESEAAAIPATVTK